MDQAVPPVRIVVVQSAGSAPAHPSLDLRERADHAPGPDAVLDAFDVLKNLGESVEIERLTDHRQCRAAVRAVDAQLVIVEAVRSDDPDSALDPATRDVISEFRAMGPPVVVVARGGEASVEAFQLGASDCVLAGDDCAEVLPVVALEQMRKWRQRRERAERRLLTRRIGDLQRYNDNIVQNINSALLVVDLVGEIAFANPSAELILGGREGGLVGQSIWDWFPSTQRSRLHLMQTLAEGKRFRGAESVVTRLDGTVVPIGISCTPLSDGDGAKLGAVAIFQDLTEIKQLQRQVLQSEKMASIGQLAAGVAHEINNPMGFIHANLYQMSEYATDIRRVWRGVEALREAAQIGDVESIRSAAHNLDQLSKETDVEFVLGDLGSAIRESQEGSERIRHIVQDLRDFSHPDAAEPTLSDVNQCVDSTASIVWTMMKHSVVLEKDYSELPPVSCFPMQLKQVFMNLLVNAYQSIDERVRDSGEHGEIDICTRVDGDGVRVSISDTGIGIAPEHVNHLFDPFFTTKDVGTGTGLGLSISYGIIQRHGGTIEVESELGAGSRFHVWLPFGGPSGVATSD